MCACEDSTMRIGMDKRSTIIIEIVLKNDSKFLTNGYHNDKMRAFLQNCAMPLSVVLIPIVFSFFYFDFIFIIAQLFNTMLSDSHVCYFLPNG